LTGKIKNRLLYGIPVVLIIIMAATSGGCSKGPSAISSPTPTGSPAAAASAAAPQRGGIDGTRPAPSAAPSPAPSSLPPSPTASPVPTLPMISPSGTISTAVPVFSPETLFSVTGGSPIVLITRPLNASAIPAGDVTIADLVSNFKVVDKIGQSNAVGEGHLIYYLEVAPPMIPSQTAITETGTCLESTASTCTWHNVAAGFHNFSVQLVNNDNTPLNPAITATVYVTVK
jgi:hypothetical protein